MEAAITAAAPAATPAASAAPTLKVSWVAPLCEELVADGACEVPEALPGVVPVGLAEVDAPVPDVVAPVGEAAVAPTPVSTTTDASVCCDGHQG